MLIKNFVREKNMDFKSNQNKNEKYKRMEKRKMMHRSSRNESRKGGE